MRYFGFLLTIPILAFATVEQKEMGAASGYKIEEQNLFDNEQIEKMLVRGEVEEEDELYSLFAPEEEEMAYEGHLEEEVAALGFKRHKKTAPAAQVYEEENEVEFFPSEEAVPERSKALKRAVSPARQREQAAAPKLAPKRKQPSFEIIDEQAQMAQRQPKRAPIAKARPAAPMKKKMIVRAPAVAQNGRKMQAPVGVKKKAAATNPAVKNNRATAQKKSYAAKRVQKKNPNLIKRPTIELDQLEE